MERVGDRRERQRRAEQAFVVVGEDVAGHEQALPDCEQVPRQAAAPGVAPRADDQRDDGRAADQVEDEPAVQPLRAGQRARAA